MKCRNQQVGGNSGLIFEHKVTFIEETDSFDSESNIKAILESVQQAKEGKIVVKTMKELERMVHITGGQTYGLSGIHTDGV